MASGLRVLHMPYYTPCAILRSYLSIIQYLVFQTLTAIMKKSPKIYPYHHLVSPPSFLGCPPSRLIGSTNSRSPISLKSPASSFASTLLFNHGAPNRLGVGFGLKNLLGDPGS